MNSIIKVCSYYHLVCTSDKFLIITFCLQLHYTFSLIYIAFTHTTKSGFKTNWKLWKICLWNLLKHFLSSQCYGKECFIQGFHFTFWYIWLDITTHTGRRATTDDPAAISFPSFRCPRYIYLPSFISVHSLIIASHRFCLLPSLSCFFYCPCRTLPCW